MMGHYGNGMGGFPGLMGVGGLLFWALVVVGVVVLVRHLARGGSTTPRRTAEDVLAERFARGELTEQEYRDGLDVLRRSQAGADG
jgi:putative membrane protein